MHITSIETYPVTIAIKPEYQMITSLGVHDVSDYLLIRVLTDEGIEGAGEATVSVRWSGETVPGAKWLIENVLTAAVAGCDEEQSQDPTQQVLENAQVQARQAMAESQAARQQLDHERRLRDVDRAAYQRDLAGVRAGGAMLRSMLVVLGLLLVIALLWLARELRLRRVLSHLVTSIRPGERRRNHD